MASFTFAGSAYPSLRAMLDSIAYQWAGPDPLAFTVPDETLADEVIAEWELDEAPEVGEPSHMGRHGYDRSDLVEAFSRLRQRAFAPEE